MLCPSSPRVFVHTCTDFYLGLPVGSFGPIGVSSRVNSKSSHSLHRLGRLLANNITIPTLFRSPHAQTASRSPEVCFVFRFVLALSRHAWRSAGHVTCHEKQRSSCCVVCYASRNCHEPLRGTKFQRCCSYLS